MKKLILSILLPFGLAACGDFGVNVSGEVDHVIVECTATSMSNPEVAKVCQGLLTPEEGPYVPNLVCVDGPDAIGKVPSCEVGCINLDNNDTINDLAACATAVKIAI